MRCFREDGATHDDTTIDDFKEVMGVIGLLLGDEDYFAHAGSWNATKKIYRFNNGSVFAFSATRS